MTQRSFIAELERAGKLTRITRECDPVFEIPAIVQKLRGAPVVFEKVRGCEMGVVSNVCATRELVCMGLGIDRSELSDRLAHAADHPTEPELVAEGRVAGAEYEEWEPDLGRLPILTHYPQDGGPYIASGIAVAHDEEHGTNASYHRAMVLGPDKLALRIVPRHFHRYLERGLKSFAFTIGHPTSVLLGAAMSVEIGKSELAIANALAPTPVVELHGHTIPQAEIVLLCEPTGELTDEGPFLDLTETFDVVRRQPVFRVRRLFVRKGALYHALLPGDLEHKVLMGMPREPTILRECRNVCDCVDVHITPGGCSWLHVVVRIRKHRAGDGKRAIEAALRGHASAKHVFVVDEDIDPSDPAQVEWAMATRFQGADDLVVLTDQIGSSLDPSADPHTRATTKVGFDLTVADPARLDEVRRQGPPMAIRLEDYLG